MGEIITNMQSVVNNKQKLKTITKSASFQKTLESLIKMPVTSELCAEFTKLGIDINGGDLQDAMSAAMIAKALAGDTAAYALIRDTAGQKPVDKVATDMTMKIVMSDGAKELGE